MTFAAVEKIADAVLFEGYILYPYRPSSIKNQQRWNFGTLFPRQFAQAQSPEEAWSFHAEMLLEATPQCTIDLRIRFLQLVPPASGDSHNWAEGFVRIRTVEALSLNELRDGTDRLLDLTYLSTEEKSNAPASFTALGCIAKLALRADKLGDSLYRLHATVSNESPLSDAATNTRNAAQTAAFTSAHLLIHANDGAFVSLLDPPQSLVTAASDCRNQGVFPVLVGDIGDRRTMLCSPIILYDYPQIAPESSGDFFDGTEMDEMLALRVMTLTDEEKQEMRKSDVHAKAILERIETLPQDQLLKVHGAVRGMSRLLEANPAQTTDPIQAWNPFEEKPPVESVVVFGTELRKGDRVRLWPQKRADIIDMALQGQIATIEAIEQDLDAATPSRPVSHRRYARKKCKVNPISKTKGEIMSKALLIISGLVIAWTAYSIAPDLWRYAKIRSM